MKMFDCVIVGGGMVGAACALSLANLGLKVAVVEQKIPQKFSMEQAIDLRVSAISLASQHLLEQLDAWSQITAWRLCPYRRLGVWEEESAYSEFNSESISQPYLGNIIENRVIQLSLWQQLVLNNNIQLFCPDKVQSFVQHTTHIDIQLTSQHCSAKLLIAADGSQSQIRTLAGIGVTGWNYQQSAMLISVDTELPQQDITWQQFLPTGPVAMLPMTGNKASLVWYHQADEVKRLLNLSNKELTQEIHHIFPKRLGKINVVDKGAFPLTRQHANAYQQNRVLLMGDAAHSINPLAGQGVNLGFKDVKALQTILAKAIGNGEPWDDMNVLARYEKQRRMDNLMMMSAMDVFYNTFSHPSPVVKTLRNFALRFTNKLPMAKAQALKYACGIF